jgi:hypothetical protein
LLASLLVLVVKLTLDIRKLDREIAENANRTHHEIRQRKLNNCKGVYTYSIQFLASEDSKIEYDPVRGLGKQPYIILLKDGEKPHEGPACIGVCDRALNEPNVIRWENEFGPDVALCIRIAWDECKERGWIDH